jgi:5,5'-dehydrodivanillate O-demethylase
MQKSRMARKKSSNGNGPANGSVTFADVERIGPEGLAGRYLRQFWHPVYHSDDIELGQATPLRIMAQDFTLYRGESGKTYLVDARCAHRAMPLHVGWVEGEHVRCQYHGWAYDGTGRCVDQPAEAKPFCDKISIGGYPTREYLGLVFAYLGEGEPPEFTRFPSFEVDGVVLNDDSYTRACHFFNNLENAGDASHLCYGHKGWLGAWDLVKDPVKISARESSWGITYRAVRESGKEIMSQFGMPNMLHAQGLPDDPEVGYREILAWWVPVEEDRHIQFTITKLELEPEVLARYQKRRAESLVRQDLDREAVARALLAGVMRWEDVDTDRVSLLFLQDDVSQMGVGMPSERDDEYLGQSDAAIVLARRVWLRELDRFQCGAPLKAWKVDPKQHELRASY